MASLKKTTETGTWAQWESPKLLNPEAVVLARMYISTGPCKHSNCWLAEACSPQLYDTSDNAVLVIGDRANHPDCLMNSVVINVEGDVDFTQKR